MIHILFAKNFCNAHFQKKIFEKLSKECDYFQIFTIILGDFNYSVETLSDFVYKKYMLR